MMYKLQIIFKQFKRILKMQNVHQCAHFEQFYLNTELHAFRRVSYGDTPKRTQVAFFFLCKESSGIMI